VATVVLLTGNHLCHNPRGLKEARALIEAGFDVEILGAWLDAELKARDLAMLGRIPFRFRPVVDLIVRGAQSALRRHGCRVRNKLGALAYRFMAVGNRWQFGYTLGALRAAALSRRSDLYIAHSLGSISRIGFRRICCRRRAASAPSGCCAVSSGHCWVGVCMRAVLLWE
jgi:hypothetical protein